MSITSKEMALSFILESMKWLALVLMIFKPADEDELAVSLLSAFFGILSKNIPYPSLSTVESH